MADIAYGDLIFYGIVIIGALLILFLLFYVSRYRKFKPNEYVIHLRNGKVKKAGTGGRVFLYPLFDEIIVIPTTVQQTLLEAKEQVVSHEYQDVALTAYIYWRVTKPETSFSKVSWVRHEDDYVETVIKNTAESIIRTTCANMPIESIIRERELIIKSVTSELHTLVSDWGLTIESVEIRDVEVLDAKLKENLEADKKLQEEEKAKVRRAVMEETTQLRNLDVDQKTGLSEQEVNLRVQEKAKEREIRVQELELRRVEIEAETAKKKLLIEADAEKYKRITQEIDVEVERVTRQAEAMKTQLLAQAEGEAARIRQKLLAEAEGLLEQVKAADQASERFIQLKTMEMLPEVFKNMKIDNMMVLGQGEDAFQSLANAILPFVQIIGDMSKQKPKEKKK